MPKNYKVAGQQAPSAGINTILYQVPSGKQFVGSSLSICNRVPGSISAFRIAVVPAGDTLASKHYLDYDTAIDNTPINRILGMTLGPGDQVFVRSNTNNLSFSLFGSEIS